MTSYAGFPCLTIEPNAVTQREERITRVVEGFAIETGNRVTMTTSASPVSSFALQWNVTTLATLNTLTDFLDALTGPLTTCWIPTYQRDLYVTSIDFFGHWFITPGSAVDQTTLITTYPSWRHWTAIGPLVVNRHFSYRGEVVDVGGGVYELKAGGSFILSAGDSVTSTMPSSAGTIFSRSMLCRLTEGYHVTRYGKASTVTADFIEVPAEAPAV